MRTTPLSRWFVTLCGAALILTLIAGENITQTMALTLGSLGLGSLILLALMASKRFN